MDATKTPQVPTDRHGPSDAGADLLPRPVDEPGGGASPSRRTLLSLALAAPAAIAARPAAANASPSAETSSAATAASFDPAAVERWRTRFSPQRLDLQLGQMVTARRTAGVSALVWQGGAERYFGAFGHADVEAARPMARDTLVRLWSMTKPVASVALMRLWDAGRFRLDDPLARYLPEFKAMRVADARGERAARRPILVRDLLRHTAGLTYAMEDGPADRAFRAADPFTRSRTLAQFSRTVARLPLKHEPGTAWHYGTATDILARLVEVLADEPLQPHVRRHVLQPLGMRETDWTLPSDQRHRFAATYSFPLGAAQRAPEVPPTFPSGGAGLVGSLDDYLRFARLLLGEGTLEGVSLLRPATVRLMLCDHLDPAIQPRHFLAPGIGFGLGGHVRVAPPSAQEAPGSVGEFSWGGMASTLFWIDPALQLAVVFFAQKLPFDGALHDDVRRAVYA